jgi:hypothetical protein
MKPVLYGSAVEPDIVEDEEFSFRAKHDRVADAAGLHVSFGLFGGHARVAVVGFAGDPGSRMSQKIAMVGCAKNGSM